MLKFINEMIMHYIFTDVFHELPFKILENLEYLEIF